MKKSRRHEGVQLENGFATIANELMEAFALARLNQAQAQIVFVVLRYTYGFKDRKSHALSLRFLEKATGLAENTVQRTVKTLIKSRVLFVAQKHTDTESRELGINKNYWEWDVKGKELLRVLAEQYKNQPPLQPERTPLNDGDPTKQRPPQMMGEEKKDTIITNNNSKEKKEKQKEIIEIKNGPDAVKYFAKKFEEKFNIPYQANWGKDGSLMKGLLKTYESELLKEVIDLFFYEDDDFVRKAGYTIGVFQSQVNKLALKVKAISSGDQAKESEPIRSSASIIDYLFEEEE